MQHLRNRRIACGYLRPGLPGPTRGMVGKVVERLGEQVMTIARSEPGGELIAPLL